jgi:protein SCO1/2
MKTLLVFLLAFTSAIGSHAGEKSESLFHLKSIWTDQTGGKTTLDRFRGRPMVMAMIYTTCQGACPLITSDMQRVERDLLVPARERTQFILVSVDPERDTPGILKKFAAAHGLTAGRWTLLTGANSAVRELAGVLGVKYRKDSRGDYVHSNIISAVDRNGVIRFQQTGLKKDPKLLIQTLFGLE